LQGKRPRQSDGPARRLGMLCLIKLCGCVLCSLFQPGFARRALCGGSQSRSDSLRAVLLRRMASGPGRPVPPSHERTRSRPPLRQTGTSFPESADARPPLKGQRPSSNTVTLCAAEPRKRPPLFSTGGAPPGGASAPSPRAQPCRLVAVRARARVSFAPCGAGGVATRPGIAEGRQSRGAAVAGPYAAAPAGARAEWGKEPERASLF
jgi:hypothetical protein